MIKSGREVGRVHRGANNQYVLERVRDYAVVFCLVFGGLKELSEIQVCHCCGHQQHRPDNHCANDGQ